MSNTATILNITYKTRYATMNGHPVFQTVLNDPGIMEEYGKQIATYTAVSHLGDKGTLNFFYYSHSVGRAIIHRGRHRHGAIATTSGNRINLLPWCRRGCLWVKEMLLLLDSLLESEPGLFSLLLYIQSLNNARKVLSSLMTRSVKYAHTMSTSEATSVSFKDRKVVPDSEPLRDEDVNILHDFSMTHSAAKLTQLSQEHIGSPLTNKVTGKLAALKGLDARMKEIRGYLDLVIKGKLPLNH
ncbi:hypothetical protein Tco_0977161 [Tanacetum coccineum]|uniref:EIF3F/CSN6-like C-terminal domain-containing protein n=1 Tax=Tanacetum coccineum TaxID=301880 RepID=A0ABQ5EJB3_9ASTR